MWFVHPMHSRLPRCASDCMNRAALDAQTAGSGTMARVNAPCPWVQQRPAMPDDIPGFDHRIGGGPVPALDSDITLSLPARPENIASSGT